MVMTFRDIINGEKRAELDKVNKEKRLRAKIAKESVETKKLEADIRQSNREREITQYKKEIKMSNEQAGRQHIVQGANKVMSFASGLAAAMNRHSNRAATQINRSGVRQSKRLRRLASVQQSPTRIGLGYGLPLGNRSQLESGGHGSPFATTERRILDVGGSGVSPFSPQKPKRVI